MARRSLPLIAASLLAVSLLSGCSWLSVFQVETDDLEAAEATETPENMVSMGYRLPTDISSIRDIVTIDGESTGDAVTNVENKLAASGIPFRTRGNIISGSVSSSSLQDCGVLQLRQNGDLHQLAATTPLTVLQAPGGNADDFLRREFSGNTKFTITVQPTTRGGFSATIAVPKRRDRSARRS